MVRRRTLPLMIAPLLLAACSQAETTQDPTPAPYPDRVVVTADWLNRSLTIFDHARLVAGASVEDARWGTVDLAAYAPGPLEIELTPDAKTAVVSVGPGFMAGIGKLFLGDIDVPPGGALLLVDLPSRSVRAEVKTADVPMGIAVAPDGKEAFIAGFGEEGAPGDTVSRVDIQSGKVIEELKVSGRPEQIALSKDGKLGIVSLDGEGSIRTFDPGDLTHTLSPAVPTSGDPSGVALIEGASVGVVTNSLNPPGYSTIDVSSPLMPELLDTVTNDFGVPFAATRVPGTKQVLLGGAVGTPAQVVRLDCSTIPATVVETLELANHKATLALGVAVDAEARFAFVGVPGDNSLQVLDLQTKKARSLQWLSDTGPTYAAVAP